MSQADSHSIRQLSFVADRKLSDRKKHNFPRNFWNVRPSGDYSADSVLGQKYALEYLAYEASIDHNESPNILGWIVADMPRELTGVEVGFFSIIGAAATAGIAEGERLARYWEHSRTGRRVA